MMNSTAAELLIRIAADPSPAEESISRFRASFSRDAGGVNADLVRWVSQGSAQLNLAGRAARGLELEFARAFASVGGSFNQSRQAAGNWRVDMLAHLGAVDETSQALQSSLMRSFTAFDFALSRNVTSALVWEKSLGAAFQRAAATSVAALAQEALVRAIFSTALGFYLLAIRDFAGAANAFESAAVFGTVGGAAALAGRTLAGSRAQSSSSASETGTANPAAATATAARTPAPEKSVQVIFQGPVYGGQAGIDELVRNISQAVTERDVNLTAFTVVRQPARRA